MEKLTFSLHTSSFQVESDIYQHEEDLVIGSQVIFLLNSMSEAIS